MGTEAAHVMTTPSRRPGILSELFALTKFRLSLLVLLTAYVGFWLRRGETWNGLLLFNTLVGTAAAAFGAAVFNQVMERAPDALMARTARRPLPAGRVRVMSAVALGAILIAFALVDLALFVNLEAAAIAALTCAIYLLVYTPMKRRSGWNTVVGAVSGALPPLIGWVAAAGAGGGAIRLSLLAEPGAVHLFALQFLWQLPHFLAINWMYREEYRSAGYVMWANEDHDGRKTSRLCLALSLFNLPAAAFPVLMGSTTWIFAPAAILVNLYLAWNAWRFLADPERSTARRLFLSTLVWLPAMLALTMVFWK